MSTSWLRRSSAAEGWTFAGNGVHPVQAGGSRCEVRSTRKTLLADLQEFVHAHRPHDGMTADATEPEPNGYRLTVACACGVVFERWVTPRDPDADLVRWAALN